MEEEMKSMGSNEGKGRRMGRVNFDLRLGGRMHGYRREGEMERD
jgi:hypothetical protein